MSKVKNLQNRINISEKFNVSLSVRELRGKVLNSLLRNYSIVLKNDLITSLSNIDYRIIAFKRSLPLFLVQEEIERFLKELKYFRKSLNNCRIKWQHDTIKLNRIVRIILYRIYRIAPIFDLERARKNLRILQSHLSEKAFWPQISTQLAIVIYVTDKKDLNKNKEILQKNIRTLCKCSAYAFHRTRNILNIM